ncbi:Tryptophan synthase alpha chain [Streptomyces glaucescens]
MERTRATTELPVCVGLGVSDAAQAAEVAGFADGVIVGSAFVKRMLDAPDEAARTCRAQPSDGGTEAKSVEAGDGPGGEKAEIAENTDTDKAEQTGEAGTSEKAGTSEDRGAAARPSRRGRADGGSCVRHRGRPASRAPSVCVRLSGGGPGTASAALPPPPPRR